MPEIGALTAGLRPSILNWPDIADDAALTALVLTANDKGKAAYQQDVELIQVLLNNSPATWLTLVSKAYTDGLIAGLAAAGIALDASELSVVDAGDLQGAVEQLDAQVLDNTNGIFNFNTLKANIASPTFTGIPEAPTASANTNNTQIATTAYADAIKALKANIASPTLTGVPLAPTASANTNNTQIATTAYADAIKAAKADTASPTFTGIPSAPTASAGTNTTQLATTGFVAAAVALLLDAPPGALDTLNELAAALGDDANFAATMTTALALKAPLASPGLTGVPTAPTAAADTNSIQLATTAYADAIKALKANLAGPAFTGTPTAPTAAADTNNTQLATTGYADAIKALKANIAGPAFTGVPTAPTAAADTNNTQLATTAYADAIKALKANIASPTFTGNPAAPTQSAADNSTKLATTAYADAAAAAAGGASLSGTNTWTGVQTYGSGKMVVTSPKVITNFLDTNGNILLGITATASATRYLGVKNTNGGNPELYVTAAGSNSDLVLRPDGAGKVQAIGGITDNDQWRIQSNTFRPGYADVVSPGAGAVGLRVNLCQALSAFEFGDSAGGGTITLASNLITWAILASSGLKIGSATTQKIGAYNVTPVVQPASAAQAALTDSTGGTTDGVLEDVTTAGLADPAKVNNNFKEMVTLVHAMRTALVNLGWMKGAA